ncbi:MAG: BlaI/MecI/CopY family transcriptional regulator [Carnobacterium sp.]|uniref:BlaI/MecI/CopY family transcriptional regulator n=1 Tax=Carnobacterium sp. TaxID=48221 RepID=UPI0025799A42|nr:BlaI/MecI/CopY family transcriptional regulator [Carnobacterium sp.]MBQ6484751.1 BlaI/MecI/CopY family transcriptional regulator [Carnobacterium sp.]
MNTTPSISEAEFQVMKVIWGKSPVSTTEVVTELEKTTDWKPKTIQTLLSRLVKKDMLSFKREGRVFVYTPLVKESDYLSQESDSFLKRFYNGTLNAMVVNFLDQDRLSDDEIERLREILEKRASK